MHIEFTIPEWLLGVLGVVVAAPLLLVLSVYIYLVLRYK
ncbi:hypothetical protein Spock_202 [Bacillus phage Spock]|uniref:Uncharacterized protein n=1 Tax=Bacillus phage Spock TaxID=1406791 RepID=U5Q0Y5_9CAUD|nr:hypothetical protein Spock_202 [Bacillus phage Spock]AGY48602.1 hypothetical protein Spock_202 [Bacillus phage Spock]